MEVVQSDSQVLHLVSHRSQSDLVASLLFGLLPMGLGFYSFSNASITNLECRRTPSNKIECVRSATNSFGWKTTEEIPGNLQAAKIDRIKGTTSVELLTTSGIAAGTHYSNNDRSVADNLIKLNNFIDNPRSSSIDIEQDDRQNHLLFSIWISAIGIFFVISSLCAAKKVICEFNKRIDIVLVNNRYLFHGKVRKISPLSGIKSITLKKSSKDRSGATYFKILLTLENNKKYSISTPSTELRACTKTIEAIEQFLAASNQNSI
jgi:hypothetical protein